MRRVRLLIPSVPTAICSFSGSRRTRRKSIAFSKFVTGILHDGQSYAAPLHYAPLPKQVVERSNLQLGQITLANGAGTAVASCKASLGLAKPANPGVRKIEPDTVGSLFSD